MGVYEGEFLTLVRISCEICRFELLVLTKDINIFGCIIWQLAILFPLQLALVRSMALVER
jgi:hypothetical protein